MPADRDFISALSALSAALSEIPAPGMIIGGVAVIAAGVPRQTIDVDAVILGRASDPEQVIAVLAAHHIVPRIPDALGFARERQVLLLIHEPTGITMEISFSWLPFEEEALNRALIVEVEGVSLRVARPEDLIIYKSAAWRDRDRSDIARLLNLHIDEIDLGRVRDLVRQIAEALDDTERAAALDQMIEDAQRDRQ